MLLGNKHLVCILAKNFNIILTIILIIKKKFSRTYLEVALQLHQGERWRTLRSAHRPEASTLDVLTPHLLVYLPPVFTFILFLWILQDLSSYIPLNIHLFLAVSILLFGGYD